MKISVYQFGDSDLTSRWIYDTSGRIIYWGQAKGGTADGGATWRIKKYSYTGNSFNPNDMKWASGTADFVHEWNERGEYTYS